MPHILVRFMAIRHEDELKLSRRIASIWVVISMAVAVFIGIVGHAVSSVGRIPMLEGSATETVIVRLSDLLSSYGLLPAIVAGCILAGILAATMSTADSQLLAAASAFSENVLQDVFGVKLPVSLLDSARWKNVSADTHGRRSAAKRINDQLQQAVHIVIRIAFL